MSFLTGGTPKLSPSPAVPSRDDAEVAAAATRSRARAAGAGGRRSTILTRAEPLEEIKRQTLLGGAA